MDPDGRGGGKEQGERNCIQIILYEKGIASDKRGNESGRNRNLHKNFKLKINIRNSNKET